MFLRKLNLLNFKTYRELEVELSAKLNCFVGNNGVGKTNLFDAIYYLSFCKSYFNSQDILSITHGEDFFMVQGEFQVDEQTERIHCALKRDSKKKVKRNDKEYQKLADHIGFIPLVMVSPADASLIQEGSEERRRYMNGVISQYDRQYLDDVVRYNKAVTQRNRLLKDFSRNRGLDEDSLFVWDDLLAHLGERIHEKRKEFISMLQPIFQNYYDYISGGHEQVGMRYQTQAGDRPLADLIHESHERDKMLQFTSVGIHKDDLVLELSGYPMKQQGSQGQQKTYLVALKMAQYDFLKKLSGKRPLILLDDVFDKLDASRVRQIIRLVSEDHFGQIFISDTEFEHLQPVLSGLSAEYRLFRVTDGSVKLM
jgi:DNA replication and repair protein RecF